MTDYDECVRCELAVVDPVQLQCGCVYHGDCFDSMMLYQVLIDNSEDPDFFQYICSYCKSVVADEYVTKFHLVYLHLMTDRDVLSEAVSLARLLASASISSSVSLFYLILKNGVLQVR